MTTTITTTIRVSVRTRDLVNKLIRDPLCPARTVDEAIQFLYEEHCKSQVLADWDRLREQRSEQWQQYRELTAELDDQLPSPAPSTKDAA